MISESSCRYQAADWCQQRVKWCETIRNTRYGNT